ncbi:MAG TPA: hypothetical protein VMV23_08685 [Candidatus Nanopelagicaceae bacterium]|nr:hypothetical protein [Candidatus Nanopelagicaceae bacterium]
MAVDDTESVGLDEADDDPLRSDQSGDMGENAHVEDFRDLNSATQALDRDSLP